MRHAVTIAIVAAVCVGVAGLAAVADTIRGDRTGDCSEERLYLPNGEFLHLASLGYDAAVADYTWLQAIQYYGGYRRGEHDVRYFAGLVEAVTTLDPGFVEAYIFSALVHSLDHGDADGAIDVLKRGILQNPHSWRLHFEVGFTNYVFKRDYGVAAYWFETAARLPGASDFCRQFAAWSSGRAGDLKGSLVLWENLRRTTENPDLRELAERMTKQIAASLHGEPMPGEIGPPSPSTLGEDS